jgi:hypothetical protein
MHHLSWEVSVQIPVPILDLVSEEDADGKEEGDCAE